MKNISPQQLIANISSALSYGGRINPSRDWLVLLSIFGVLFFISIAWNLNILFTTLSKDPSSYAQTTPTSVEEDVVDKAKELIETRETLRARFIGDTSFVDPLGE